MTEPSAAAQVSDRELITRHCAGDQAAFGQLVLRHRDRLWRVALRTLGDAEDAADALQDALLSAFRAAHGFRGDAAVTTWLHRIVVNACLDLARRRAARPTQPLEEDTASAPTAPDALGQREAAAAVLTALRRLPAEQAAAIVLVDIEGYPVAEAADILEAPVGTIKSRCARGRARMAELLGPMEEFGSARNPEAPPPVQPDGRSSNPLDDRGHPAADGDPA